MPIVNHPLELAYYHSFITQYDLNVVSFKEFIQTVVSRVEDNIIRVYQYCPSGQTVYCVIYVQRLIKNFRG